MSEIQREVVKTAAKFPKVELTRNLGVPVDYNGAVCQSFFYVYVYRDPKNDVPIYVGKGIGYRAWSHLNNSHNPRLNNLISKRSSQGYAMRPSIEGFFAEEEAALELEKNLISSIGRDDLAEGSLFNASDGGEEGLSSGIKVEFRGELFGSIQSLCREYKVDPSVYRGRISLGWSMEEALGLHEKIGKVQPIEISAYGKTYSSLEEFSEKVGLGPKSVQHRLKLGFSPEQLIDGEVGIDRGGVQIEVGKQIYRSRRAFARAHSLSIKAVEYWLETGWSPEEIADGQVAKRSALYTVWNGIAMTQTEFARVCNISHGTLIKYRSNNLTNEEIFELGHRSQATKLGGHAICYAGTKFASVSAFNTEVLQMPISTVWKWLFEFHLTPEQCNELVSLARRYLINHDVSLKGALSFASSIIQQKARIIEVEGMLVSTSELRNICRTSIKNIEKKLAEGLSGDEIVVWAKINRGDPPTIQPFEYDGTIFKSYAAFDRHIKAPIGTTARYHRLGLSSEEIIQVVETAKKLIREGQSPNAAYRSASRDLNQIRKGGKKLKPKVIEYIKARRAGLPPKEACISAGLSKGNSSRLEKTYSVLIENTNAILRGA